MHRREFIRQSVALASLGWDFSMASPASAQVVPDEFTAFQAKRRRELWSLLGDLPEKRQPHAKLLKTEKAPGYTLEHLELDLNGFEAIPAYLLLPDKRQEP